MKKTYNLQGKLKWFDELNPTQVEAVLERQAGLVVTAGAGCGKTRTLVARYLSLLGEGLDPRSMAAITFTEKAAREMRSRVRSALSELVKAAENPEERYFWAALEVRMDAARIGTIHSLCAEILRFHPAEALLDPLFEVMDEGLTAVLRAHIVEDTLAWLADQEQLSRLFSFFSLRRLQDLLLRLLERRLDVQMLSAVEINPSKLLADSLDLFLQDKTVLELLAELKSLSEEGLLAEDAGDKLQAQIEGLLSRWPLDISAPLEQALRLFELRREFMGLRAGKKTSRAKEALRLLRDSYDLILSPWLGGAKSSDEAPERALEELYPQITAALIKVFERIERVYKNELSRRRMLDFDDLEQKTLELLQDPQVQCRWQAEFKYLLVDEFQDTNERQRRIFELLSAEEQKGKLFFVGDERQSIYRFRGADVSVFAQVREDIRRQGGRALNLDATFRSHADLLQGLGDLLQPVMGLAPDALSLQDPQRLFDVRYFPLAPQREKPRQNVKSPYVEFILGEGEDSRIGRQIAARALALRLQKLKELGEIRDWEDVALLFRASGGFEVYEEALAEAEVPYVTVAGSGFYERPEVRDLLNMLRALSSPQDDLLLAGFLRSPALGLSDEALYRLRWQDGHKQPLLAALQTNTQGLSEEDQKRAAFALEVLERFLPLADRLPAADLLQRLVNDLNYQAILAAGKERLSRNLEKLLEDARASGLVRLRDFLDYLESVRAVGVREGEASLESRGAVQLLTIHKSKGLEFKIVVLADAARRLGRGADPFYLFPECGLGVNPDNLSASPLVYRIAAQMDAERAEAEEKRLLYVALTRAREKVILSGHVGERMGDSYLKRVLEGVLEDGLQGLGAYRDRAETWQSLKLGDGREAALLVSRDLPQAGERVAIEPDYLPYQEQAEQAGLVPLYLPIPAAQPQKAENKAANSDKEELALLSGSLFHRAAQSWLPPGDERLRWVFYTAAQAGSLSGPQDRERAIRRAEKLYETFYASDFRRELEGYRRRHEVPCLVEGEAGEPQQGYIDLLCRTDQGWLLVEFKTDHIADAAGLEKAQEMYAGQIQGYKSAVEKQVGQGKLKACFCWLDYQGEIRVEEAGAV